MFDWVALGTTPGLGAITLHCRCFQVIVGVLSPTAVASSYTRNVPAPEWVNGLAELALLLLVASIGGPWSTAARHFRQVKLFQPCGRICNYNSLTRRGPLVAQQISGALSTIQRAPLYLPRYPALYLLSAPPSALTEPSPWDNDG